MWTQGGSLAISSSYLDILWLAANVGNYFKIRGNQSNDYTLITASLMIMIIMTLPDPRLLPPPLRATFCLFESLDLDWWEMRRAWTGATGQSSLVFALTTAPLLHWPHIMRRDAGHWYIHHPMHAPGPRVFCSRWAWQMAGPKFGVQMMDSEYCSKTAERLQHCSTAAWRIGGADLPVSHYSDLVPLFCLPKQSNRSWFQIAIVIFKSGSDLGRALRKSWVWSRLESQPASSITGRDCRFRSKTFPVLFLERF